MGGWWRSGNVRKSARKWRKQFHYIFHIIKYLYHYHNSRIDILEYQLWFHLLVSKSVRKLPCQSSHWFDTSLEPTVLRREKHPLSGAAKWAPSGDGILQTTFFFSIFLSEMWFVGSQSTYVYIYMYLYIYIHVFIICISIQILCNFQVIYSDSPNPNTLWSFHIAVESTLFHRWIIETNGQFSIANCWHAELPEGTSHCPCLMYV